MQTEPTPSDDDSGLGYSTLGKPLAAALDRIGRKIHERSAQRAAEAQEEPEGPPLPLVDEEKLAQIADPQHRAEKRRWKENFYREFPKAREMAEQQSEALRAERNKVLRLTPWADDKRAAPNLVFRSALFPAINSQTRKFLKEQKVYSVGGLDVTFTGEQFAQSDLDVYLEILNFAKGTPLGQPVKFSAYAMLKALGRCTGKSDHKWLHSVLIRLRGGTVEVLTGKARYFGGLIEGGFKDEVSKHYEVMLNPNYALLFGFGMWSAIDLEQRRALAQKSTAKALHAYYSTHTGPSLHRYETLASVVGLENKNRREMKATLIRAHEDMKQVGFLLNYEAKPTGIEVKATMTPGQQQHALKKITRRVTRKHLPKDTG